MKIKKYISINRKLLLIYLKNPKLPGARDGAKVCLERILQAQNSRRFKRSQLPKILRG